MKRLLSAAAIITILFLVVACSKNEEQPASPSAPGGPMRQGPIIETPVTNLPGHGTAEEKMELHVVVPLEVKEQWSAVKLIVEDKKLNKTHEFIVNIGEEIKIPDSTLTIMVVHFLPDFKMSGRIITSASNNPDNPSAGVIVYDNGKQIFPVSGKWGWIYAKFPTIHPFQHERFDLILKEGVKK